MAHSLEARVPFLDPVVTNFALALPARHRVRGLRKKVLLRKAVAPLVPGRIVRGKKRGFSIPAAAWLRGELEPFARETLSAETLRRQGFFRPEAVTKLIDRHVAGKEDLSPPALGPARLHALARAPRRARAAGPARAAPGGARPLTELPEFELGYPGTDLRRQLVDAVLAGREDGDRGPARGSTRNDAGPRRPGDLSFMLDFDARPPSRDRRGDRGAGRSRAGQVDLQFARDEGEGFESVGTGARPTSASSSSTIRRRTRSIVAVRFRAGRAAAEGLDRHHRAGPRAGLPAADRDPARARRHGRDHRARLRADGAAARAARDRGRRARPARRALAARQVPLADLAPARPAQLGARPRVRRRARARLARADA